MNAESQIAALHTAIKERLHTARHILLTSHIRPDGDAIGSLLGLGLALDHAGKTVQMVLESGVPKSFRHLAGSDRVRKEAHEGFDTFITLDCADFKRVGVSFQSLQKPDINIDHHKTNEMFGVLNLVESDEVATTVMLTKYLPVWGLEITPPVAQALLTGLITDTLGFRTSNMTPAALRYAAQLMEIGADISELYMQALVRRSYEAARYWGAGLSKLERSEDIIWATLTLEDRKVCGYNGDDDADLINMISSIEGGRVGMIFVEQPTGHVKVSWRALEKGVDVSIVANHFGGGGHAPAAGANIAGRLDELQPLVLKVTKKLLRLR
ncbi:MAG: bifunctional oligoribonuclease/PAP phosphatase NrnA [Anaerolineales bacterium]